MKVVVAYLLTVLGGNIVLAKWTEPGTPAGQARHGSVKNQARPKPVSSGGVVAVAMAASGGGVAPAESKKEEKVEEKEESDDDMKFNLFD
ncbi:hypothetical protein LWI28_019096 [Acer negundo]|uniref:Uncharacterized protein n=1 Tax=Acer negundo TaxID=4023 RepID=A0AAD5IG17_ACENE|nr:hypothetical protein LWI28_019096 [Acer negundo]KAK4843593.1 hypothetical protein QYF36_010379 [Acer negundo]